MFKYRSPVQKCDSPRDRVESPRVTKLIEKVYDTPPADWPVELLVNQSFYIITIQSCRTSSPCGSPLSLFLRRLFIISHAILYFQWKQLLNRSLLCPRSASLGDDPHYCCSNIVISCSTLPSLQWLRGRLSSNKITTSPTDIEILLSGLDFWWYRFLNSATYSLLQRFQKCSSSNCRYFLLVGISLDDTAWLRETSLFHVKSGKHRIPLP